MAQKFEHGLDYFDTTVYFTNQLFETEAGSESLKVLLDIDYLGSFTSLNGSDIQAVVSIDTIKDILSSSWFRDGMMNPLLFLLEVEKHEVSVREFLVEASYADLSALAFLSGLDELLVQEIASDIEALLQI